ncbi:Alpha-glucosidase [Labeo rohita]|uniref:Alpha-glucosidase n=1 Tax=Labeo rohita TaxID=84645 RepID=A0ABQ8LHF5_LABRO|nr:Alpha-glucosidase [Labeo rohita]
MAEYTVQAAMVDQGARGAMAEYTVHAAMEDQGARVAMAEDTVQAAKVDQGARGAIAEYTVRAAMAEHTVHEGSPPQNFFLGEIRVLSAREGTGGLGLGGASSEGRSGGAGSGGRSGRRSGSGGLNGTICWILKRNSSAQNIFVLGPFFCQGTCAGRRSKDEEMINTWKKLTKGRTSLQHSTDLGFMVVWPNSILSSFFTATVSFLSWQPQCSDSSSSAFDLEVHDKWLS